MPLLVHTIGHSFTSNGTEAHVIAHDLGPGWQSTTSGVGGMGAIGIAAQVGAWPYLLHPTSGKVPASGPVRVLLDYGEGPGKVTQWPLLWNSDVSDSTLGTGQNNDGGSGIRGTLEGIPGELTITRPPGTTGGTGHLAGDVYEFTRDEPGDALAMDSGEFVPTYAQTQFGGIVVVQAAINSLSDMDGTEKAVAAIIKHIGHDRWIVVGEWLGANDTEGTDTRAAITAWNRRAAHRWGDHFVDIQGYAVSRGLAEEGIVPTAEDEDDIARGVVPSSLRRDGLHPNGPGFEVIGGLVADRIRELGWVAPTP